MNLRLLLTKLKDTSVIKALLLAKNRGYKKGYKQGRKATLLQEEKERAIVIKNIRRAK